MQTDIVFTTFEKEHIEEAVRLSKAASWPHRTEDWEMVLDLSQGVVGIEDGKVVATALATSFGPVATMNMIIVDETMRGRGLGRKVMATAMNTVEPVEWRLVATSDGLPLYEKLGFEAYGEVVQCQGIVAQSDAVVEISDDMDDGLVWAVEAEAQDLAELDKDATGMARMPLLEAFLRLGSVLTIKENGTIVAWAALRSFGRGHVAGPVVARNREEAKQLLSPLLSLCDGKFLRVDTTKSADLEDWLAGFGLARAGGGISMRKGPSQTQTTGHKAFALASQALG
ncbi:GNAT family N-acetyltransferase [Roseibium sp. HPY-6]|uniref:GNAT family N-acetyltransferase n=1 Tax=Roseibium sp. HPY-6 TaxID=3229852 RepID=UPI00338F96A3